jgi:glyoxylase-like metal-dependent hydrolase (beta-lactamase superfamily II)
LEGLALIPANFISMVFITSLILFGILPISALGQNVQATEISADVIVLHPAAVLDLAVIRDVGGTLTAVNTNDGLLIVDALTSIQAGMKARNLIKQKFPNTPAKYLINTHHHADHVKGNQCFRDACIIGHRSVESYMIEDQERLLKKYGHYQEEIRTLSNLVINKIFSSDDERKKYEEDLAFWNETKVFLESYMPTPPSLQISANTILKFGGKTFEILFFGNAHTDNDLVVLDREDRLLIMGDLLCHRKCNVMGSQSDAENWIALLDHLIDRQDEYDHVIPGHGGVDENVHALIEQRDYLKNVCEAVIDARQKRFTLDEIKATIHLEQYRDYLMYDRIGLDIEAYWRQLEKQKG